MKNLILCACAILLSIAGAQAAQKPTTCPSGSDMRTVLMLLKNHPELYIKDLQSYHLSHNDTTVSGLPDSVKNWMQQNRLPGENGGIHLGALTQLKIDSKLFSTTGPGVPKSITKDNLTNHYCDYSNNLYGKIAMQKKLLFVLAESY